MFTVLGPPLRGGRSSASAHGAAGRLSCAQGCYGALAHLRLLSVLALAALATCVRPGATTTTAPATPAAAAAVPSTDIYLYRLSRGVIPFRSRLVNITNRPGYDN